MIKHIMAATLLWLAIAAVFPIYGQQQTEKTLGSLWSKVEENYPGVEAKSSAVDAARFNQKAVRGTMLPQLNAQAQNTYGTYEGNAGAFFPQTGFFNVSGPGVAPQGSSTAANTFGSATIQWEVFSFGKLRKKAQAAGALYSKAVNDKDAYVLSLKKSLSERYIALLYNDAKLQWTDRNAERLNEIRKIAAGLSASGLKSPADSLLSSSSYIQAKGEHDKWNGFKKASLIKLQELYGEENIDYGASALHFASPVGNEFDMVSSISPSHPLLDALNQQSEYYALSAQSEKRASLPSLNLLAGYAYRGTSIANNGMVSGEWIDGFNNTTNNYLAGIGLTWNLTSLHTSRMKGESLFKDAKSAKLLQSEYQQAMQADLSASQSKISEQYNQLQKTKIAVQQSQDAYNMYLARYKSGLITLSELLQIQNLLQETENVQIEVSRDYWQLLAYEAELTTDFDFLFNSL